MCTPAMGLKSTACASSHKLHGSALDVEHSMVFNKKILEVNIKAAIENVRRIQVEMVVDMFDTGFISRIS